MWSVIKQDSCTYHVHIAFEAGVHLKEVSCFLLTASVVSLKAVQVLLCHLHWSLLDSEKLALLCIYTEHWQHPLTDLESLSVVGTLPGVLP